MWTEILIVIALIALNGLLAMSELSIVSARPARLKSLEPNSKGASIALRLAEHPGRFLSTVQIGITLVGVLSGAFSGATLGLRLTDWLAAQGMDVDWASRIGVGTVVVIITYFSLIIGELVPKQLALKDAESIAIRMAPSMALLSRVAAPLVWLLESSGKIVLFLLGQSGGGGNRVTEEEVHTLLTEAHEGGVIEAEEREMISGVMRFSDRSASALMTPRRDVEMVELEATPAEAMARLRQIGRPRVPVTSRASGDVVGIVTLADAFSALATGKDVDLRALVQDVPVVSDRADALDVLQVLRDSKHSVALVYDEYGHFEGLITSGDVLEAITGAMDTGEDDEPALVLRDDGSMLVAGWMPADEFCDRMNLPREAAGDYDTVAGLVLNQMRRLPALGEKFDLLGYRIEVIDLDGLRIDKVLVMPI
jgi:putative hemolysin